jgi:hypothetical protein
MESEDYFPKRILAMGENCRYSKQIVSSNTQAAKKQVPTRKGDSTFGKSYSKKISIPYG